MSFVSLACWFHACQDVTLPGSIKIRVHPLDRERQLVAAGALPWTTLDVTNQSILSMILAVCTAAESYCNNCCIGSNNCKAYRSQLIWRSSLSVHRRNIAASGRCLWNQANGVIHSLSQDSSAGHPCTTHCRTGCCWAGRHHGGSAEIIETECSRAKICVASHRRDAGCHERSSCLLPQGVSHAAATTTLSSTAGAGARITHQCVVWPVPALSCMRISLLSESILFSVIVEQRLCVR